MFHLTPPPSSASGCSPAYECRATTRSRSVTTKKFQRDITPTNTRRARALERTRRHRSSSCDTAYDSSDDIHAPASLPPIVHHLSLYVNRARRKFKPYNRDAPTMWALRFAEGYLTPGNTDTSPTDIQRGKHQLRCGLRHLSHEAMAQAVLTKEADIESRRLSAMATAWRIEVSERHTKFLHMVLECDADTYASAASERLDSSVQALVNCSKEELQDHVNFGAVAYKHDVMSFAVADEQLTDMEGYAVEHYRSEDVRAGGGKQALPVDSGNISDEGGPESVHESTENSESDS
ncbi:hypothetical protein EV424DRAFT_1540570 [Suillus variegatus]|nr:hypothetical protein EV424DRAFT_1540570 [Suillus variegatus]